MPEKHAQAVEHIKKAIELLKEEYGEHVPPRWTGHTAIKAHTAKPESEGYKDYGSLPESWYACDRCGTHCSKFSTKNCMKDEQYNAGWQVMLQVAEMQAREAIHV